MIFDGPNRRIVFEVADGDTVDVVDIYSAWKRWVRDEDGAQYPAAFTTFGGDPLGGGVFAGAYFFLATDQGWLIRPREAHHSVQLNGNLYPVVAAAPMLADTLGPWRVQVRLQTSSLTQSIATAGTSASDVANEVWSHATAQQVIDGIAAVEGADEVWAHAAAQQLLSAVGDLDGADEVWAHAVAQELLSAVTLIRRITDNRLEVDFIGQRLVLYADDGVTLLRTWPLTADGGGPVTTDAGVQTRRGAPT